MPKRFLIPANLRGSDILDTTSLFWEASGKVVTFDFSELAFAFPFPTLVLAAEIQSVIQANPKRRYEFVGIDPNKPAHSYLAHVGFFRHIGHDQTLASREARGGSYVPITELTRRQLSQRLRDADQPLGFAVQKEAEDLARVLTQSNDLKANRPIAYCIREVIRNVFEHEIGRAHV